MHLDLQANNMTSIEGLSLIDMESLVDLNLCKIIEI